ALHERGPRRRPAGRADHRAARARPRRREVRARPAGPGAPDPAGRQLAPGAPRADGRRGRDGGRAPLHVAARRAGRRVAHGHVRAARPAPHRPPVPGRVLRPHNGYPTVSARGGTMRTFSFRPALTLRGRRFKGLRGWAGKPSHPPLTDVPVGAFVLAAAFDVISIVGGDDEAWARDFYRAGSFALIGGAIVAV